MKHIGLARIAVLTLAASCLLGCAAGGLSVTDTGTSAIGETGPTIVRAEELPTADTVATDMDGNAVETDVPNEEDIAEIEDEPVRPDDWTEETHGKSADPNYEVVFPQDEVNRIDIAIDPDTWQEMLDDMASLYGAAGTRQAGGDPADMRQPGAQDDQQAPEPPADGEQAPGGRPTRQPGRDMARPGGQVRPGGAGGLGGTDDTNPVWVPVTIEFEGQTWSEVGMRFKGNSSLRSSWSSGTMKLPFRLDFDQFEDENPEIDDQRFFGFQKVTFASNFKDTSFLHEKVAADLFREAGVPAANTAFYEVYVDYGEGPVYFGLYTMTEVVEDTVIEEQFEDDSGNVYKPEGAGATFAVGSFSEASFDKQTNEDEGDYSDIIALYDALHAESRTTNPGAWRSGLEAVFDVDGFLNWLAVNTVIQNWDTYGVMSHNYYLYHDPETDLLTWIPWDNNEALYGGGMRGALSMSLEEVGDNWPLIRYLMDDEVYHDRYVAFVEGFNTEVFESDSMAERYRQLAALIEPSVMAEETEYTFLQSAAAFDRAIDALIDHAVARYNIATNFVADQSDG